MVPATREEAPAERDVLEKPSLKAEAGAAPSSASTASSSPSRDRLCNDGSSYQDSDDQDALLSSDSMSRLQTPEACAPKPGAHEVQWAKADERLPGPASKLGRAALGLLHLIIYTTCHVMTFIILSVRSFVARFLSGTSPTPVLQRPNARLSWEMLTSAADPYEAAKRALPVPPKFPTPPEEGMTISFGPCANLMIYTGGIAACLQQCPNYAEVSPKLRFYGVSCGAFLASMMAADQDILRQLPEMLTWTAKFRGRLMGLIGAYSASIKAIVWDVFSDPSRFERANGRLGIGVTAFTPAPERVAVHSFESADDLVRTLMGSCYIPVAFEEPQWSSRLGPLWDGGILEFATTGDFVASPYEATLPDVYPKEPYPRSFTFFPPHESDAVKLFEDGYMDCLRWLEAGAHSRTEEREAVQAIGSGLEPLIAESKRFLRDIVLGPENKAPGNCSAPAPKAHQA